MGVGHVHQLNQMGAAFLSVIRFAARRWRTFSTWSQRSGTADIEFKAGWVRVKEGQVFCQVSFCFPSLLLRREKKNKLLGVVKSSPFPCPRRPPFRRR